MIPFFRKIRWRLAQNNQPASPAGRFFKYSRYAIGEIVLVVIGILIALQINNWNEKRKLLLNEQALYKKLVLDFTDESKGLKFLNNFTQYHQDANNEITNKTKGKFNNDSSLSYNYLQYTAEYHPKIKEIYQESLNEISNESIRDLMREYNRKANLTISAVEQYNDYKTGVVRPFLERNGLYNFDFEFPDNQNPNGIKKYILINIDKLEEHYNSDEFKSIIVSLRIHLRVLVIHFQKMDGINNKLIMALENEIKKE